MTGGSSVASDGDGQGGTDLPHALIAETAETVNEDADGDAFHGVHVDGGLAWDGVLAGVEHDLAG